MTTIETKKQKQPKILNEKQKALFIKYYPVVRKVVNSMRNKLPMHADLDELHSVGVANLPNKQRKFLEGYYFKEKKLGEIAKEFGLTEARICQIHSQALSTLRPKFLN